MSSGTPSAAPAGPPADIHAFRRALEENAREPEGPGRNAGAERLLAEAEQAGRAGFVVEALIHLLQTYNFSSEQDKMFVPFARLLRMWDERPEDFDEEDAHRLFWMFKWVSSGMTDQPHIPLAAMEKWLAEMEHRYRVAGHSERAVRQAEYHIAEHVGDDARAARAYAAWRAAERDSMSDCHACELRGQGSWEAGHGNDAGALELWRPVLTGVHTCAHEPHATLAESLLPLLRLGRLDEARAGHLRGHRMVRRMESMRFAFARHVEFCALTGNEARGLELLAERPAYLADRGEPSSLMAYLAVTALLTRRLAALGMGGERVVGPPAAGGADGEWTVAGLGAYAEREALTLAGRFDARNGTAAVSENVRERMAREPLVERLPLGLRARRPRWRGAAGVAAGPAAGLTAGSAAGAGAGPAPAAAAGAAAGRAGVAELLATARERTAARHPQAVQAWADAARAAAEAGTGLDVRDRAEVAAHRAMDPATATGEAAALFRTSAELFEAADDPGQAAVSRARAAFAVALDGRTDEALAAVAEPCARALALHAKGRASAAQAAGALVCRARIHLVRAEAAERTPEALAAEPAGGPPAADAAATAPPQRQPADATGPARPAPNTAGPAGATERGTEPADPPTEPTAAEPRQHPAGTAADPAADTPTADAAATGPPQRQAGGPATAGAGGRAPATAGPRPAAAAAGPRPTDSAVPHPAGGEYPVPRPGPAGTEEPANRAAAAAARGPETPAATPGGPPHPGAAPPRTADEALAALLAFAEPHRDDPRVAGRIAEAHDLRAGLAARRGETERAAALYEQAVREHDAAGVPWYAVHARAELAGLAARRGDRETAERAVRGALEHSAAYGRPAGQASLHLQLADVLCNTGREAEGAEHLLEAAHWADEAGDSDGMGAWARHHLGGALLRLGRPAEAATVLEDALADIDAERHGEGPVVQTRWWLGDALRRLGEHEQAAEQYVRAAETAAGWDGDGARDHAVLATLAAQALSAAEIDVQAERAYERAGALWRELGDVPALIRTLRARAWLAVRPDRAGPAAARELMAQAERELTAALAATPPAHPAAAGAHPPDGGAAPAADGAGSDAGPSAGAAPTAGDAPARTEAPGPGTDGTDAGAPPPGTAARPTAVPRPGTDSADPEAPRPDTAARPTEAPQPDTEGADPGPPPPPGGGAAPVPEAGPAAGAAPVRGGLRDVLLAELAATHRQTGDLIASTCGSTPEDPEESAAEAARAAYEEGLAHVVRAVAGFGELGPDCRDEQTGAQLLAAWLEADLGRPEAAARRARAVLAAYGPADENADGAADGADGGGTAESRRGEARALLAYVAR